MSSTFKGFNCLPGHDPDFLANMIWREGVTGLDIRYCRDVSEDPEETLYETCAPEEAEIATLYLRTSEGLAEALHDVDYGTREGEAEMAEALRMAMSLIFWNMPSIPGTNDKGDGHCA